MKILLIPGLLANEDRARLHRTFTEHRLRRAIGKGAETTGFRLAQKRFVGVSRLAAACGPRRSARPTFCDAAPSAFAAGAATI